ncbi:MAG: hypothetical protein U0938_13775 [Thiobacillus sp.]|nr:hypothetical protein [Thiobacillus sp.]
MLEIVPTFAAVVNNSNDHMLPQGAERSANRQHFSAVQRPKGARLKVVQGIKPLHEKNCFANFNQ